MRKHAIRSAGRTKLTRKMVETPMSAVQLARLISEAGKRIDPAIIRRHIKDGAPADKRGRLRLARYAAWLAGQVDKRRTPAK